MQKQSSLTRRRFLKRAAGAAAAIGFPAIVPASVLGANAPGNLINVGFIGVGSRGTGLLNQVLALPQARVVAVCDVYKPNRDRAAALVDAAYPQKGCAAVNDFRELVARPDIDGVFIASTDNWHVLHALAALRAGKDVYVEKPMGMTVQEDQALREEVRRRGAVFQFGTHQRSGQNWRFAAELVRNGRIGKLQTIKVGSRPSVALPLCPAMPVPADLDYDLWLGPAPWAPYTFNRVLTSPGPNDKNGGKYWWFISDYSLGWIAGCGIHEVDVAAWGMGDPAGPVEVEGAGVFPADGLCDCATAWDVRLSYPGGVTLHFTDNLHNAEGTRFEGTGGWVHTDLLHHIDAYPKSLLKEQFGPGEIRLPVSTHHQANFIDCIRSRARTAAPIESAVRSDLICHLSHLATRLGRKLKWDPVREEFPGDPEAAQKTIRPLREPWSL